MTEPTIEEFLEMFGETFDNQTTNSVSDGKIDELD